MMPSQKRQQKVSACVIASLVFLEGLLLLFVIHICLSWRDTVGESSQHLTSDLDGDKFAGCRTKVAVLNDEAMKQKWHTCSAHFSKAWSKAGQNLTEPADKYMEKSHSLALNMFTEEVLKQGNKNSEAAERTPEQRRAFEPVSLYSSLSEAILILKQNQVMCLSTYYRSETVLELNVSAGLVRFSTFILGSNEWHSDGNVSCFDVYSCFGANITKYSILKGNNQVLIPPYEVFTVTDVQKQTSSCKITYKLRSNLNCVYDKRAQPVAFHICITCRGILAHFHHHLFCPSVAFTALCYCETLPENQLGWQSFKFTYHCPIPL